MPRRLTITDASGRRVPLLDVGLRSVILPGSGPSRSPDSAERAYREAMGIKGRRHRLVFGLYFVLMAVAAALTFVPPALAAPFFVIALAGAAPVAWSRARRANRGRIEAAILRAGHCPSCGYGLRLSRGAGEQTLCPECGAVWRAPETNGPERP